MERLLDVSTLEPCEPLQLSIAAARDLGPGEYLRIRHRREPKPLFPMLQEMGFSFACRERPDKMFDIYVWSASDDTAAALVAQSLESSWP